MASKPTRALERIYFHAMVARGGGYAPDAMISRLLSYFALTEAKGAWMIRDIHSALCPLKLNEVQLRILAEMMDQAAEGKPIRIVILKSRKTGVTTFTETLACHLCAYLPNQIALTVAHADKPTHEIFEIARLAAECHSQAKPCDVQSYLRWHDTRSKYMAWTAGGVAVGAGGTPSIVHTSEGPKWEKNKEETFYNLVNSVPYVPNSIIVHEFTAKGRESFYDLYESAGEPGHPYRRIFVAWYLDSTLTASGEEKLELDSEEQLLLARARREGVELSDGQLRWRRQKIAEIGADLFRQEYPSTAAEAVQATKGLVFPHMREALADELPFDPELVEPSARVGGIDFGYNDPTVIWSGYYVDQVLWLTDYWRDVETMATDQIRGLKKGHLYYCDPSNITERLALQRESQAFGMRCRFAPAPRKVNVGEDVGRMELQAVLKMLNDGRLKILHQVAPQLIVECDTLAWNERTGKVNDKRNDACAHYDSVMALKYIVMGLTYKAEKVVKRQRAEYHPSRRFEFAGF